MEATEILVIILSSFLAVFLLLGIIFLVFLIRVTKSIGKIAEKADSVVSNVEAASETLRNAAGPLAAGKFMMNVVEMMRKGKKGRG